MIGIFVESIERWSPASKLVQTGWKILEVCSFAIFGRIHLPKQCLQKLHNFQKDQNVIAFFLNFGFFFVDFSCLILEAIL